MSIKRQSMTTTTHSLYQSFDSTLGDSSAYFSAVDSDEDSDKTIANIDSPPMVNASSASNGKVPKKTPKHVSFIATSTNRYSSLTKNTIQREFKKACISGPGNDDNIGTVETVVRQVSEWKITDITDVTEKIEENEENKENDAENASPFAKVPLPVAVSAVTETGKTVLGAAVENVTLVDVATQQSDDEKTVSAEILDTVVELKNSSMPIVGKKGPVTRNSAKNAKQQLTVDTKKHQSRMSMYNRPTANTASSKPMNARRSMAVVRNVIAKARQSMAAAVQASNTKDNTGAAPWPPVAKRAPAVRASMVSTLAATNTKRTSIGDRRVSTATNRATTSRVSIVPSSNSVRSQRRQSRNFLQPANQKRRTMQTASRKSMAATTRAESERGGAVKESKIPILSPIASTSAVPQSKFTKGKRQTITTNFLKSRLSTMPPCSQPVKPENPVAAQRQVTATGDKRVSTLVARLTNHFNNISKKVSATVINETRKTISRTVSTTVTSEQTSLAPSETVSQTAIKPPASSVTKPIPKSIQAKPANGSILSDGSAVAPATVKTNSETTNQIWKCEPCKRVFHKEFSYKLHVANFHNITFNAKKMSPPTSSSNLKCKYCDRSFGLQFALDKHIVENCTKISPTERKRFIAVADQQAKSKTKSGNTNHSNSHNESKLNTNKLSNSVKSNGAQDACDGNDNSMLKLNNSNMGHSGIYRTPSKSIPCKLCNIVFLNCVEYAEHCVDQHP